MIIQTSYFVLYSIILAFPIITKQKSRWSKENYTSTVGAVLTIPVMLNIQASASYRFKKRCVSDHGPDHHDIRSMHQIWGPSSLHEYCFRPGFNSLKLLILNKLSVKIDTNIYFLLLTDLLLHFWALMV